jgi:hypothetical protein
MYALSSSSGRSSLVKVIAAGRPLRTMDAGNELRHPPALGELEDVHPCLLSHRRQRGRDRQRLRERRADRAVVEARVDAVA